MKNTKNLLIYILSCPFNVSLISNSVFIRSSSNKPLISYLNTNTKKEDIGSIGNCINVASTIYIYYIWIISCIKLIYGLYNIDFSNVVYSWLLYIYNSMYKNIHNFYFRYIWSYFLRLCNRNIYICIWHYKYLY